MASHRPKRTYYRRGGRGRKRKGLAQLSKTAVKELPAVLALAATASSSGAAQPGLETTDSTMAGLKQELADTKNEMTGLKKQVVELKKELRMQIVSENKAAIRKYRILAEKNLRYVLHSVSRKLEKESLSEGEKIANISAELETATQMVSQQFEREKRALDFTLRIMKTNISESMRRIWKLEGVDPSTVPTIFPPGWGAAS